jgi:hypothetical protein
MTTQRSQGWTVLLCSTALVWGLAFSVDLKAQIGTATLSGNVTDPAGALIPGAHVSLQSTTEKAARETVSDPAGAYIIPSILPGMYQLVVKAPGFATQTLTNIILSAGQGSTLNVALGIARTAQMVTVKEAPPLLDTTTATVASEVTAEQFVALPMLGRNFQSLLAILPGVAYVAPPNGYNFSVAGSGINPSVYGQRNRDNDYTIDGVPNNEINYNAIATNPPPEAIAEMKVQTGSDLGAYGGSAGATVTLVTKSGTNKYHGNAWEFLQNNALNARSFFLPNVGAYRWNQLGGTFGGPLILPHLRRERAWYVYGWYEGVRIHSAANYTGLVPTAAELQGDFSADPESIYNPYSSTTNPDGSLATRQVFSGNQIPTGLLNSTSVALTKALYPAPNLAPGVIPGVNYLNTGENTNTYDQWSTRIDHQFGPNNSFYARFTDARNPQSTISLPSEPSLNTFHSTNLAVSETHTFSPSFLVTARFGIERTNPEYFTGGPNILDSTGLVNAYPPYEDTFPLLPSIGIPGYAGLGQSKGSDGPEFLYSWTADAQRIVGRHAISFGGRVTHTSFFTDCSSDFMEFSADQTAGPSGNGGDALASFLLGLPESVARQAGHTAGNFAANSYAWYVQDTFRATPKLTLNLGVRWDVNMPLIDKFGHSNFDWVTGVFQFDITNPITGAPANVRPGGVAPDYRGYQPRVGIAYSITPKTVVRASDGVFSDAFGVSGQIQQGGHGSWPFAFTQELGGLNLGLPTAFILNPFPGPPVASTTPQGVSEGLNFDVPTSRVGYVQEWSLSVQRQVTPSMMFEVSYAGSHGVKLSGQIIDNTAVVPGTTPIASRQKWPNFPSFIENGYNEFSSKYNGLTLKLDKRTSRNLTFLIDFTWQKTLDNVDSTRSTADAINNPKGTNPTRFNLGAFWGPASFDIQKIFNASYIYEIPFRSQSRFARVALANWQLSGTIAGGSGAPYVVYLNQDSANIGSSLGRLDQFPNMVSDPNAISKRTAAKWFNTAAYQIPTFGTLGNAGKHALFSDPLINWDSAFMKRFPFGESRAVEFRTEFFDFLNLSTFAPPQEIDSSNSSSFGTVSTTRQGGRTIQFGLKLHF